MFIIVELSVPFKLNIENARIRKAEQQLSRTMLHSVPHTNLFALKYDHEQGPWGKRKYKEGKEKEKRKRRKRLKKKTKKREKREVENNTEFWCMGCCHALGQNRLSAPTVGDNSRYYGVFDCT